MNKANFDMLKNLPVPEGWIENAIAIPEQEEKGKAVVPIWRNRAVIAAASLVLVSALGLLLYLSFGVKPPVEVKNSSPATELIRSTDASGETVATEAVIVPDATTAQDGTQPTEQKTLTDQAVDRISGSGNTSHTTDQSDGGRVHSNSDPDSDKRGKSDPTKKSDPPEEQPVEEPQDPTDAPYEPSTESPGELPTESPTEPPVPILKAPKKKLLYVGVSQNSVPTDETVYCKLETDDGEVLGNYDMYADERRMTILATGSKYTYYYVISNYLEIPVDLEGSAVVYYIYDEDDNILTTGSYQL